MASPPPFSVRYASIAETQIDAALLWWQANRPKAAGLLAREIDQALDQLALVPRAGRRVHLRGHSNVRRLLLRVSSYHLYYAIDREAREVQIVYFRHARRGPLGAR